MLSKKNKLIEAFQDLKQKTLVNYLKKCIPSSFTDEELTKFLHHLFNKYPNLVKDPNNKKLALFIKEQLGSVKATSGHKANKPKR